MNDMTYDVDRSKDIYSCLQADKYTYKRYRAFRVVGEKVFWMKRFSFKRTCTNVYFYLVGKWNVSAVTKLLVITLYHTVTMD